MSGRRYRRRQGDGPADGPRQVHEALEKVMGRLGMPGAGTFGVVFARWEEIAGPALASHVRPIRVSADGLVVAVDRPAWATQVRMLSGTILDRVAEVGGERPARLEVVVQNRRDDTPGRS